MTAHSLPFSSPAAQGVDARGLHAFLDTIEAAPDIEPHSLMVLRHGHVVAQGWWAPYSADRRHLLYSLSKSFTSTAAAFAAAEGLLRLDDPVIAHFPELDAEVTDPRSRSMLVRHVASMASGHAEETWGEVIAADPVEPVRAFLKLPPDQDPGTIFAYNQSCTYTLAAIIQRASGQTLTDYLRPRLFDPLGIGAVAWQQHPAGRDLGFTGLHVTTDAIAALGQLYLQRGSWNGEQLLSEEWVAEATRSHVANAGENIDWRQGYGFQFWMSQHGYRGDGAYGQFALVLPEQDAVVAITASTVAMQSLLDAAWKHVLPALGATAVDADADAGLRDRMSRLALPVLPVKPAPSESRETWSGVTFTPADGTCAAQPSLIGVGLADQKDGWQITLRESGSMINLRLDTDGWRVSDAADVPPTAVSGGWIDPQTLRFEVIFLETPHRLVVTCGLSDRTFDAEWATEPLGGNPLRELRSPRPS
ncbi:MAG TPA: serine hydrolase domain-containing protein [Mycobacteriales bacterium]